MQRALILLALLLAGCGGGSLPPAPGPSLPSEPRPGVMVFSADWSAPSIGVGLECSEDVPPRCFGSDAPWLTFNRPGTQGQACVDPGPNACYRVEAAGLYLDGGAPGWPMITAQTFAGPISVEASVSATCTSAGCFFGPVVYNGEMEYRAVYVAAAPDDRIQVWLYTPRTAVPLSSDTYRQGTPLLLGLETDGAGNWTYLVNRQAMLRETPGSVTSDTGIFGAAPHLALFMGAARGTVGRLDVYATSAP